MMFIHFLFIIHKYIFSVQSHSIISKNSLIKSVKIFILQIALTIAWYKKKVASRLLITSIMVLWLIRNLERLVYRYLKQQSNKNCKKDTLLCCTSKMYYYNNDYSIYFQEISIVRNVLYDLS